MFSKHKCNEAGLVQKYIGSAYGTVKAVSIKLPEIAEVAASIPDIVLVSEGIDSVKAVASGITEVVTVAPNVESVIKVADSITEVTTVSENMDTILNIGGSVNYGSWVSAVGEEVNLSNYVHGYEFPVDSGILYNATYVAASTTFIRPATPIGDARFYISSGVSGTELYTVAPKPWGNGEMTAPNQLRAYTDGSGVRTVVYNAMGTAVMMGAVPDYTYDGGPFTSEQLDQWRAEGDVRGWGAVPDGLISQTTLLNTAMSGYSEIVNPNATDNTLALNTVANEVCNRGGASEMVMHKGVYMTNMIKIDTQFDALNMIGNHTELRLIDTVTYQFLVWTTTGAEAFRCNRFTANGIDFNCNGGGGSDTEGTMEGGVVSINKPFFAEFRNCVVRNATRHTDGIATTGDGTTVVVDCVLHDTNFQCIYTQSAKNVIKRCKIFNSGKNGVAVVTPDSLHITDCEIYGNSEYGVLAFSSATYKGGIRNLRIDNTSITGNGLGAYQIGNPFVIDPASKENITIVMDNVRTQGNGGASIVGNTQAGDTEDGYSIDSFYARACSFGERVEFYRAKDVYMGLGTKFESPVGEAIRLRVRVKNINIEGVTVSGSVSTAAFNTVCYIYENTIVDGLTLSNVSTQGDKVSLIFAETGVTVVGKGAAIRNCAPPSHVGTTPYQFNAVLYNKVVTDIADRPDRFLCRESWGEYKAFYSTGTGGTPKQLLFWDGSAVIDALGQVVT